jgi:uncharacterized protein YvpB
VKDLFKSHSREKKRSSDTIFNVIAGIIVIGMVAVGFSNHFYGLLASTKSSKTSVQKKVVAKPKPLPQQILLQVTPQSQLPQLPNGAEVTTLSMLFSAVDHPVSKVVLAQKIHVDPMREVIKSYKDQAGQTVWQILKWGDPNVGYVGNMYQSGKGYGVYHAPILTLINKVWPRHGVNLTGKPFSTILTAVGHRRPVEIWSTLNFQPTTSWISWQSPEGLIKATPDENTGLIVGYNKVAGYVYVDNPGSGTLQKVPMKPFEEAWKQLGSQAVTVTVPVPLPKKRAINAKTSGPKKHSGTKKG